MGSGLRHAASKNRSAAGFDHISRVSVAFPNGEGKEEAASPPKKKANPASLRSAAPSKGRGLRGYSLLPMEGGAPKGRRLDGDGGMKKSEEMRLKQAIYESTLSTADAVPLPQTITPCGITVNENGFLLSLGWRRRHSSFPIGRLSPLSKLFWSPLLNHILSRAYAP